MTKRFVLMLAFLVCVPFAAYAETAQTPADIKYPQLDFKPPKTVRVALKNGMVLHLLEDHELPLLEITSLVRIGSAWEPAEKAGLAALAGHLWRSGGTKTVAPGDMDERLAFIGARMETSIGAESGTIGLKVLSKDIDEGLALFADTIKNPAFDEKRFATIKDQMEEALRREYDEPDALVEREFLKAVFRGHPFGQTPTPETVERIAVEDCRVFYQSHIGPESFVIGIAGDFDPKEMTARFEKMFADFKPAAKKFPPLPKVEDKAKPGVYLLDKDLPQTALRLGHIGISRKDPDFDAARVMNYILGGGGFSSRLMKEVRTKRGLAYAVWSYFSGGDSDKGAFILGGETKTESTAEFIAISRQQMNDVIEKGITAEELQQAKEAIINSFIFAFDKNADVLGRYLWIEYYRMPKDYLETFRARIDAITLDQARAAAKKHLRPDRMVIIAVGNAKKIDGKLAEFGKITPIKIGAR